jgi:hypothetical protein
MNRRPIARPLSALVVGLVALVSGSVLTACSDDAASPDLAVSVQLTSQNRFLHKVGVDEEKIYGWNQLTGTAQVGGEAVQVELLGEVDYVNGSGNFSGFLTFTFPDQSMLGMRMTGGKAVAATDTTEASFSSNLEVIDGTGRYLGTKGKGTFTGTRKDALGGDVVSEFNLDLTTAP